MDWTDRLAEALARYQEAADEEAAAWGPTDGLNALPKAVMYQAWLDVAGALPQTPETREKTARLQRLMEKAQDNADDRRRCERWRAAWGRYQAALAEVETVIDHAAAQP